LETVPDLAAAARTIDLGDAPEADFGTDPVPVLPLLLSNPPFPKLLALEKPRAAFPQRSGVAWAGALVALQFLRLALFEPWPPKSPYARYGSPPAAERPRKKG
jgi:hypothetical protein